MMSLEDILFHEELVKCSSYPEDAKWLEIINYADCTFDVNESQNLNPGHLKDFTRREAIETSAVVGPFFWWTYNKDSIDPCLQLIFRKSDVQRKSMSHGWELLLSYSFRTRLTSGYAKGTPRDGGIETMLKQVGRLENIHPLDSPTLLLYHELGSDNERAQRVLRERVREMENALIDRYAAAGGSSYLKDRSFDLDTINRDLAGLQCRALQKRPQAWKHVVERMEQAAMVYYEHLPDKERTVEMAQAHNEVLSRLSFMKSKLEGLENYTHTTLQRLSQLRDIVTTLTAKLESRLSIELAFQQHRIANASRKDSMSMKTLTLLGAMFLPGTFLSSMFSMSFFDFSDGKS
ncbi:hypothetical protein S40285_07639 [Stachybotrys chlorohalonatus IBT 40285]|uniref:Uncharacterized protein n=1 Tax=Stachybotrys chlorohalonatus (strain IBT 40285) TaxID=1283841 RepID=A0A084QH79_STAC4|nr:hypothetical protein S40285_07639 [Stachybotrys chlorohalonata IBT 40285]